MHGVGAEAREYKGIVFRPCPFPVNPVLVLAVLCVGLGGWTLLIRDCGLSRDTSGVRHGGRTPSPNSAAVSLPRANRSHLFQ